MIEFLLKINDLQKTKRYAKYPSYTESTSEHTYKLILIVDYLYEKLNLKIDYEKCIKIAIYHDFSEIDMSADIDAFESSKESIANIKKTKEQQKIDELSKRYNQSIKYLFQEYEKKESAESRFVNACDKLEACLHVLSVNAEIMNYEFFATYSDKAMYNFPEILPIYKEVKKLMKKRYLELGYIWKSEYDIIDKEGE